MEEATSSHSWWLLSFPFDRSSRSRPAAALEQLLLSLMYGSKHHLESSVAEAEERWCPERQREERLLLAATAASRMLAWRGGREASPRSRAERERQACSRRRGGTLEQFTLRSLRVLQEEDRETLDQSRSSCDWSIWQPERSMHPTRGKRQPKLVTLEKELLDRSMLSSLAREARPRKTVVQEASSTWPRSLSTIFCTLENLRVLKKGEGPAPRRWCRDNRAELQYFD